MRAVEGVNGAFRRMAVRHLDEAKAPRAAGLTVGHDPDRVDAAIGLEELAEVLLRGGKGEVAHKNIRPVQVLLLLRYEFKLNFFFLKPLLIFLVLF